MDGNGLSQIEDPNLADTILDKVNAMTADTAIRCLGIAGTFAILPQSSSVPLVVSALAFGALYFLNGKIPKVE